MKLAHLFVAAATLSLGLTAQAGEQLALQAILLENGKVISNDIKEITDGGTVQFKPSRTVAYEIHETTCYTGFSRWLRPFSPACHVAVKQAQRPIGLTAEITTQFLSNGTQLLTLTGSVVQAVELPSEEAQGEAARGVNTQFRESTRETQVITYPGGITSLAGFWKPNDTVLVLKVIPANDMAAESKLVPGTEVKYMACKMPDGIQAQNPGWGCRVDTVFTDSADQQLIK
ncbi:hypothetical protein H8F21_14185 [Pseudomonas sp. P66]|uniref:Uncharacterized protein n=1 Tax=Pseudomonas arcuscaelestis TaxID=2710591 RepID=A0ABS2BYL5_9PSED|nr:hypothetical protein [Pseudomonas arcuscaelestis]MBM5458713.1 hypothetical protein [Pseudomonas arcuscaelestis]